MHVSSRPDGGQDGLASDDSPGALNQAKQHSRRFAREPNLSGTPPQSAAVFIKTMT
jgi:hypothetical protein